MARRSRAERFYARGALQGLRAARSTRTLGISLPINASLSDISQDLRAYGEDEIAAWVLSLNSEQHARLGELAWEIVIHRNQTSLLALALALAAVELHDGAARTLKRKRRLMKVYDEPPLKVH